MKLLTIADKPATIAITALISICALLLHMFETSTTTVTKAASPILTISLFLLGIGYIYSIRVRLENIALRNISKIFWEINQIYRTKLSELFNSSTATPLTRENIILASEEQTLKAVCQRIETIFRTLINRNCMVTIKLVTMEEGRYCAKTYVRSQDLSERDDNNTETYHVGSGKNTGFDIALSKRDDGLPPHFFSPDLSNCEQYLNERDDYLRFYRSTILVPISNNSRNDSTLSDVIGFLSVDTLSKNRLNNSNHLYMLSALSSQMYNFISLLRGKYIISANGSENE